MSLPLYLEECASTNDAILQHLPNLNGNFFALYTLRQKQGRGQYGNRWQSAEIKHLAFSFAVSVAAVNLPSHLFNFHTACCVAQFLDRLTHCRIEIKWPNDLILKGKKIAGLLLERKSVEGRGFYIVGIGLNVLETHFNNLPRAASLRMQTGQNFSPVQIAEGLQQYLQSQLLLPVDQQAVLENVNSRLFRRETVTVFLKDGIRQNGIIRHVTAKGDLCVDLEISGRCICRFKEIEMLY